jgi:hypothetical protein
MKYKLSILLFLIGTAAAQLPRYDAVVLPAGTPNGPANVAVCQSGGSGGPPCTPLAVVYSDAAGSGQITQPFKTDINGHYYFYAPGGTYVTDTYGTGYTTTLTTVTLTSTSGSGGSGLPNLPTSPTSVPQTITYTPGVSSAAGWGLYGVIPRESVCSGNVDTILSTDRGNLVTETDASACAVSLPTAGSVGFTNNYAFIISNLGTGTVTVTPNSGTIAGSASLAVNSGGTYGICSDNTNYLICSAAAAFPDLTDTPSTILTSTVPLSWSVANTVSGNNPQFFRAGANGVCFSSGAAACNVLMASNFGVALGSTSLFGWSGTSGNAAGTINTTISAIAAGVIQVNSGAAGGFTGGAVANKGFGISQLATSTISNLPVPVKPDTSNANQVVVTTTADTGSGIVIGIGVAGCTTGAACEVMSTGIAALTLGTGTCAIGNFVIVDTTTNGRVKCTATYTAGTVIGVAMAAQSTVGSTFNTVIGLR